MATGRVRLGTPGSDTVSAGSWGSGGITGRVGAATPGGIGSGGTLGAIPGSNASSAGGSGREGMLGSVGAAMPGGIGSSGIGGVNAQRVTRRP